MFDKKIGVEKMKLYQTRTFGSGKVYLLMSDEEFQQRTNARENGKAKLKMMHEKANHLAKLRKMQKGK